MECARKLDHAPWLLTRRIAMQNEGIQDAAKRAQYSLEERARFFALSLDLLCIIDRAGIIHDVSASVHTLLGYHEIELLGTPYLELIHPDDHAHVLRGIEAQKQGQ